VAFGAEGHQIGGVIFVERINEPPFIGGFLRGQMVYFVAQGFFAHFADTADFRGIIVRCGERELSYSSIMGIFVSDSIRRFQKRVV
jgi:hypothetical protein